MPAVSVETSFKKARKGVLPAKFKKWRLADEHGTTVAHVAAQYDHLPDSFDKWDLADKDGHTVTYYYTVRRPQRCAAGTRTKDA